MNIYYLVGKGHRMFHLGECVHQAKRRDGDTTLHGFSPQAPFRGTIRVVTINGANEFFPFNLGVPVQT